MGNDVLAWATLRIWYGSPELRARASVQLARARLAINLELHIYHASQGCRNCIGKSSGPFSFRGIRQRFITVYMCDPGAFS